MFTYSEFVNDTPGAKYTQFKISNIYLFPPEKFYKFSFPYIGIFSFIRRNRKFEIIFKKNFI